MPIPKNKSQLINQILNKPEIAIEHFNLIYIQDDQLTIRRAKKGKTFKYVINKKPVTSKKDLERINELTIPPAWGKVRIAELANGHLQAIGRDLKGRKQYKYHPVWTKVRNQTKFYRMLSFGNQLRKIREKVESDLNQNKWEKSKVIALVIKLMDETHIRIGNEQYAKKNNTYGLSTLRTKHLTKEDNKLRFEFTGKRGKEHKITIKNKRLIKLINQCEEIPGWELFQFFDSEGQKHRVESGMINNYINEISQGYFTAKDFRTWGATIAFFESLRKKVLSNEEQDKQKNILEAYDAAASALGNTRKVCRKYYVHPFVVEAYQNDTLHAIYKDAEKKFSNEKFFAVEELAVLTLLEHYTPSFSEL